MIDYLPLMIFVFAGVVLTCVAKYGWIYGRSRFWRTLVPGVYYAGVFIAAYFTVVWWQAVIQDKGGLWTMQHYFPLPGLWFTLAVLALQVATGHTLWFLYNRNRDRMWRQYSKPEGGSIK